MDSQTQKTGVQPQQSATALRNRVYTREITLQQYYTEASKWYSVQKMPLRAQALLTKSHASQNQKEPQTQELLTRYENEITARACTLTVTLIVRNEAKIVRDALNSIDTIADEIIVIDTGSTDATKDIAAEFGATILSRPWNDNFSDARNSALEQAHGRYILWIDADDRVCENSCASIRACLENPVDSIHLFRVVNSQYHGHGPGFMQARLFPNSASLRFTGRIHEQILTQETAQQWPVVSMPDITIYHTGYQDHALQMVKADRNIKLLALELQERPNDPALLYSLGDAHAIKGDSLLAIETYASLITQETYDQRPDLYTQALYTSGWLFYGLGEYAKAKRLLFRCLYIDKTRIEAAHLLGLIFHHTQNLKKALYFFVAAISEFPPVRSTALDPHAVRMNAYYYATEILLETKKYKEAIDLSQQAICHYPSVVEYYSHMGTAMLQEGQYIESAPYFIKSILMAPRQNPVGYLSLAKIFLIQGDPIKAVELLHDAIATDSATAETYVLIGDIHRAVEDPRSALQAYERALCEKKLRASESVFWKAASAALDASDVKKAKRYVKKIVTMHPDNAEALDIMKRLEMEVL